MSNLSEYLSVKILYEVTCQSRAYGTVIRYVRAFDTSSAIADAKSQWPAFRASDTYITCTKKENS